MPRNPRSLLMVTLAAVFLLSWIVPGASAAPLPGGTLDPLTIPKFVIPLVIPPVMNNAGTANDYDVAVRQFQQQILPGGIWNTLNGRTDTLPPTTVWSYGPAADPTPAVAPDPASQFNYPAYTIETSSMTPVNVRWRNELVAINPATGLPYPVGSPSRMFLQHLLPVDQTLHWANPSGQGCADGTDRTDCATTNPAPYTGPVPIVTHVHGAHVAPHSDGYPEGWWLPDASNLTGFVTKGTFFDDKTGRNPGNLGWADYSYFNDQPAATLWYHDHSLGMTRSNVYAGPAGFWLVRGGAFDGPTDGTTGQPAVLPGPAPVAGEGVVSVNFPSALGGEREKYREIPIAIQDRSFNADGSLFYPNSRAFFDGFAGPYIPDPVPGTANVSDIAPIWNPEAFFNTIVVNGTTWPTLEVAPAIYRFRLLNGCNSRFLNLSLWDVNTGFELPFYQIGAEQGFLPQVAMIQRGFATLLPGNGTVPAKLTKQASPQQALLMGLAERADVIVDFRGLPAGTRIRMLNTAPDSPFGGFPAIPANPDTTGQVMEFVVNSALRPSDANTTPPQNLVLNAEGALGTAAVTRPLSLNEEESATVCVDQHNVVIPGVFPPLCGGLGVPAAPKAAKLGLVGPVDPLTGLPTGIPLAWHDMTGTSTPVTVKVARKARRTVNVTENPALNAIEDWDIHNFTEDAHPIHLHMVRFQVINRRLLDGTPSPNGVTPWEKGYKDSVVAYPGEITTVRARFDIPGLFVWHCHIVEHEDNEMMRPFFVGP